MSTAKVTFWVYFALLLFTAFLSSSADNVVAHVRFWSLFILVNFWFGVMLVLRSGFES